MAEYSLGRHGLVRYPRFNEGPQVNRPVLVKEELNDDIRYFSRVFYSHKITNLIFPGAVIEILQASCTGNQAIECGGILYNAQSYRIYSLKAAVDDDHAIYSSHMQHVDRAGNKILTCDCSVCRRHCLEHRRGEETYLKAFKLAMKLTTAGITLPYDDPTDYCSKPNGQVVFFEIEDFDPHLVKRYIENYSRLENNQKKLALKFLERYMVLYGFKHY